MRPLSLAAGVLPEHGPEVVVQAAGEAGYPFVGLTIDPEHWDSQSAQAVERGVRAHGIGVLDVEVVWIRAGGELRDDFETIIDAGAALGARNVLVASRESDVSRNAEALHRLCERAAPAGMRVALEFLMIAEVRSLSLAHEIVSACDHPAAAILIDTLHFQRAGESIASLAEIDRRLLPYAQLCDGNLECEPTFDAYLRDALDLRSAAGEGELPLRDVLACLPDECPLSLEVRSERYRQEFPRPVDRARAILERTSRYLAGP